MNVLRLSLPKFEVLLKLVTPVIKKKIPI
nr:unnamed protein product [Callosobruchus analis]